MDGLHEVAAAVDRSPAQVAINWLLQKPGVTAPIIGARRIQQLESNLGATGWSLSPDQVAKLDVASEISLPYPYDFISKLGRQWLAANVPDEERNHRLHRFHRSLKASSSGRQQKYLDLPPIICVICEICGFISGV